MEYSGIVKLTQLLDKPPSVTLLNIVLSNKYDIITIHDVVSYVTAAHGLRSITVSVTKHKRQAVKRTFRYPGGCCILKLFSLVLENSHDMSEIFLTDDVNKQAGIFTKVFMKCLDVCTPIGTKAINKPYVS